MHDRSVGPMAGWFLDHLRVPNVVFSILLSSFPALVTLLVGPVISVKSDRHRGRRGRRIPFLLVTTPIAGAGMLGLAATPWLSAWLHRRFPQESEWLVAVACFGIFWAAFEVATVAGQAVFGGLINDVVPRELLGRFYGLFRAVSLIDGMIFNFWLMGLVPRHFTLILVVIAVFYCAAFTWVCLRVREGQYPPPPPPARRKGRGGGFLAEVKTYVRECFASRYYLSVFLMLMTAGMTFSPVNVFSIPYARSLGVDMDMYGKSLALTYLISLCLSYFLGWLADLFHPLRLALVTLAGYGIVAFCGAWFATTPETFLIIWVLHGVLAGSYFSGAASMTQRLFPRERFAQFASAGGIVLALGNMVLSPLAGMVIDSQGNDYRQTFAIACVLAGIAFLATILVYRQFLQLGARRTTSRRSAAEGLGDRADAA